MTTCAKIQPRLTAYLDGELADEHGSVVRGHLRECAACREVARDEAALRDGLRELPPVDPPPQMWAGIQAQLAAAEVADARKPAWRRALARLAPSQWVPSLPQLAGASALAATAVVALYLRTHHPIDEAGPVAVAPTASTAPPAPAKAALPAGGDVTAELQAEPARVTASYAQAVDELAKLADDARPGWSDDRKAAFDGRVAALRGELASAGDARARQRAERALIRYLQGAVVRDDILLASGGPR